jgi:hypothetical protein
LVARRRVVGENLRQLFSQRHRSRWWCSHVFLLAKFAIHKIVTATISVPCSPKRPMRANCPSRFVVVAKVTFFAVDYHGGYFCTPLPARSCSRKILRL